jgi:hypothetical protein
LVVAKSAIWIGQKFVGRLYLLEFLLGDISLSLILDLIGMTFQYSFAMGGPDFRESSVPGHAQCNIRVYIRMGHNVVK